MWHAINKYCTLYTSCCYHVSHTVAWLVNVSVCSVRFLILDPHYTGKEDLKTILNKVHTFV